MHTEMKYSVAWANYDVITLAAMPFSARPGEESASDESSDALHFAASVAMIIIMCIE